MHRRDDACGKRATVGRVKNELFATFVGESMGSLFRIDMDS